MSAAQPSDVPPDVAVARGIRALRTCLLATVAACLALGAMAVAVTLLTATDSVLLWPGLSLLATGQLEALLAAVVAGVGLRSVLVGTDPLLVRDQVSRRLRRLARLVLATSVAGVVVWGLLRPESLLVAVPCAVVTAQLAAVLYVLRARTL